MANRTPYQEGFRARAVGDELKRNPYMAGTLEADAWRLGWEAQDEHLEERGKVLWELGF